MKLKGQKRAIAAAAIAAMKRKGKLWGRDASGMRRKGVRSAGNQKAKISAPILKERKLGKSEITRIRKLRKADLKARVAKNEIDSVKSADYSFSMGRGYGRRKGEGESGISSAKKIRAKEFSFQKKALAVGIKKDHSEYIGIVDRLNITNANKALSPKLTALKNANKQKRKFKIVKKQPKQISLF